MWNTSWRSLSLSAMHHRIAKLTEATPKSKYARNRLQHKRACVLSHSTRCTGVNSFWVCICRVIYQMWKCIWEMGSLQGIFFLETCREPVRGPLRWNWNDLLQKLNFSMESRCNLLIQRTQSLLLQAAVSCKTSRRPATRSQRDAAKNRSEFYT